MGEEKCATVKCMLIGESGVGKTSLVVSYAQDDYPDKHEPTAIDKYVVDLRIENLQVNLQICDAGGAESVRSLREISYPDVHVILLCFSVVQPGTLWALRDRWLPELASNNNVCLNPSALKTARCSGCAPATPNTTHHCPAFVLVGCACDLRNDIKRLLDLSSRGEQPVDDRVAQKLAVEFGAEAYIECSALTQKHLKKVFDLAVWHGLRAQEEWKGKGVRRQMLIPPNIQSSQQQQQRRSASSSLSRKHQKQHQPPRRKSLEANNRVDLSSSQRSLWRKLMCFR